jgi:hypothetical protein
VNQFIEDKDLYTYPSGPSAIIKRRENPKPKSVR